MSEDISKIATVFAVSAGDLNRSFSNLELVIKGLSVVIKGFKDTTLGISSAIKILTNNINFLVNSIGAGLQAEFRSTAKLHRFGKVLEKTGVQVQGIADFFFQWLSKITGGTPGGTGTGTGTGTGIDDKKIKKTQKGFIKNIGKMSGKMALAAVIMEPLGALFGAILEPLSALTPIFEMFGTQISTLLIPLIPPLIDAFMALSPVLDGLISIMMPQMGAIAALLQLFADVIPILIVPAVFLSNALAVITGNIGDLEASIIGALNVFGGVGDKIDNWGIWNSFDTGKNAINSWIVTINKSKDAKEDELQAVRDNTAALLELTVAEGGILLGGGPTRLPPI